MSCRVRVSLNTELPGVYVTESTAGVLGKSNTGEVFYPLRDLQTGRMTVSGPIIAGVARHVP
jgi:hypothetical protein